MGAELKHQLTNDHVRKFLGAELRQLASPQNVIGSSHSIKLAGRCMIVMEPTDGRVMDKCERTHLK